jgi:adenylate kinase
MLDGFPRTTVQADALDSWLASRSSQVTAVFLLKITEAEAVKRAEGRRVCPGCGGIYNSLTCAPRMADICDTCGGTLKLREDDRPAVLKNRIMAYKDQTEPLIAYYRGNTEFFEIRADQPPKDVTIQIAAALKTLEKH